jgi:hypothetical protein
LATLIGKPQPDTLRGLYIRALAGLCALLWLVTSARLIRRRSIYPSRTIFEPLLHDRSIVFNAASNFTASSAAVLTASNRTLPTSL